MPRPAARPTNAAVPAAATGTRMIHEVCMSEEQMRAQQDRARSVMQGVRLASPPICGPNDR